MMNIGIFAWFGYTLPMAERARLIHDAGFHSVMLWMDGSDAVDVPPIRQPDLFRKHGLKIANAHLPFERANDLWNDNADGQGWYEALAANIADCGQYDIPAAVVHPSFGSAPPPPNKVGLDRVKRLVELGERVGVDIAFENLRRPDELDCIFGNIESSRLKFCYDSGHEYVVDRSNRFVELCERAGVDITFENLHKPDYFDSILSRIGIDRKRFCCDGYPDIDLLGKFGDRVSTIHLHDNDGTEDQHRMPFDGAVPWDNIMARLKKSGYHGDLTLESGAFNESDASEYSPEEYLAESMKRARKLVAMI